MSSGSPVCSAAEAAWLSLSSQLTRRERLGQEGVFGADQEPSADTQGSAASAASSPMGFSLPLPSGKKTKPSLHQGFRKKSLCAWGMRREGARFWAPDCRPCLPGQRTGLQRQALSCWEHACPRLPPATAPSNSRLQPPP